jgi:hypothetical protein
MLPLLPGRHGHYIDPVFSGSSFIQDLLPREKYEHNEKDKNRTKRSRDIS